MSTTFNPSFSWYHNAWSLIWIWRLNWFQCYFADIKRRLSFSTMLFLPPIYPCFMFRSLRVLLVLTFTSWCPAPYRETFYIFFALTVFIFLQQSLLSSNSLILVVFDGLPWRLTSAGSKLMFLLFTSSTISVWNLSSLSLPYAFLSSA